jgi:hypothetical protein
MAVNSAFANAFGGAPMGGLLGSWPPDPSQPLQTGLLPALSGPQPTMGVLGVPGDPASLFSPAFDPYQLAGGGPQSDGGLGLMADQLRALRALRDHIAVTAGWLGQPAGQGGAAPDAVGGSTPPVQPPPPAQIAGGDPTASAMTPVDGGSPTAFDPSTQLTLDPRYTVQPGDNLSSIAGRYVASGLYPDVATGVGALSRRNGLSTSRVFPGQALTVPSSASPQDARLGRAVTATDAQAAAVRAARSRSLAAASNGNSAFIPGIPVGSANETWPTPNNADSMHEPGPAYDWSDDPGIDPGAKPRPDWRASTRHVLGEMFAPEVNAYEYGVVQPFWTALSALANSPLGDPGTYDTIQSIGPQGAIVGGGLGAAAKGLDWAAKLGVEAEATEAAADGIRLIGGKRPPNSKYAGQVYPLENLSPELQEKYPDSVRFTDDGYPDFSPYATHTVTPPIVTGIYGIDRRIANRMAGLKGNPKDFSWHHRVDAKTLELIPTDLHNAIAHWGGVAVIKHGG